MDTIVTRAFPTSLSHNEVNVHMSDNSHEVYARFYRGKVVCHVKPFKVGGIHLFVPLDTNIDFRENGTVWTLLNY